jgi:hypothetical protein
MLKVRRNQIINRSANVNAIKNLSKRLTVIVVTEQFVISHTSVLEQVP